MLIVLLAVSILLLIAVPFAWRSQQKRRAEATALSRRPNNSPVLDQLDNFYRQNLFNGTDRMVFEAKYLAFMNQLRAQSAHMSQVEQDEFMMPLVVRNAEYIALGKRDKNALKARLGM